MPTYEYKCEKCGITFEKFQNIKEEPIKNCPKCNGPVRRLIGPGAGVIFKGSGFYATEYRSENYKKEAKKEEGQGKTLESKVTDKKKTEVSNGGT